MKVVPEVGIGAAHAPAIHQFTPFLFSGDHNQGFDKLLQLGLWYPKHKVGVAANGKIQHGNGILIRLVTILLGKHKGHVAVGTIADQAVEFEITIRLIHPQHGDIRQKADARQLGGGRGCQPG